MTITPYQAKWPNEILAKCINDGNGNTEKISYNFRNYASPSSFFNYCYEAGRGIINRDLAPLWQTPGKLPLGVSYGFSWLSIQPPLSLFDAQESRQNLLAMHSYSQEIYVNTPDEIKIHGILAPGQYWTNKAILFCNSRGTQMEQKAWEYLEIAKDAGCTGLVFNHRGVGKSEGSTSANGQALDGYAMFDYLVSIGFNPNDIICYGASQGGGTACEVAKLAQKQYPWASINHISERSFCSAAETGYALGRDLTISHLFVDGFMYLGNASNFLDSKENVKSLKGRVFIIYHEDDPIVLYSASLNKNIQLSDCCAKEIIRLKLINDDHKMIGHNNHVRSFTGTEKAAIQMVIRRMFNIPEPYWLVPDDVKARLTIESRLNYRI